MSGFPSPSMSTTRTPRPMPISAPFCLMPAEALTSVKVPSPLLRKSKWETPLNSMGGHMSRGTESWSPRQTLCGAQELAVAEILVKLAGQAADFLFAFAGERAAADEEDVDETIAVEIEEGNAAAERFEQSVVVRVLAGAGGEFDAGFRGDVVEVG